MGYLEYHGSMTEKMMTVSTTKLGTGSYGTVYKGALANGRAVAVKCFNTTTEESGIDLGILRELVYLKSLPRHPNVIEILQIEWYDSDTKIRAAMPLYDMDLHSFIRAQGPLSVPTMRSIMKDILRGVEHIHKHGIFHRDVKTSNILIDAHGTAVLCDFSLASAVEARIDHSMTVQTLWYRAPEILLGCSNYGTAVDVWSCGCVAASLLKGDEVFKGHCEIGQLFELFRYLGTPTELTWPGLKHMRYFHDEWPKMKPLPFGERHDEVLDKVVEAALCYAPQQRASATNLLALFV